MRVVRDSYPVFWSLSRGLAWARWVVYRSRRIGADRFPAAAKRRGAGFSRPVPATGFEPVVAGHSFSCRSASRLQPAFGTGRVAAGEKPARREPRPPGLIQTGWTRFQLLILSILLILFLPLRRLGGSLALPNGWSAGRVCEDAAVGLAGERERAGTGSTGPGGRCQTRVCPRRKQQDDEQRLGDELLVDQAVHLEHVDLALAAEDGLQLVVGVDHPAVHRVLQAVLADVGPQFLDHFGP